MKNRYVDSAEELTSALQQLGWREDVIRLLNKNHPPTFPIRVGPLERSTFIHVTGWCQCKTCLRSRHVRGGEAA